MSEHETSFDELRLVAELRDRLAGVEGAYEAAVEAAWQAHPDVAEALEAQYLAQADLDAMVRLPKDQRPVADLKDARVALREAIDAARTAKRKASPEVSRAVMVAGRERKMTIRALRRDATAAGLDPRTANRVIAEHKATTAADSARRSKRQASRLRRTATRVRPSTDESRPTAAPNAMGDVKVSGGAV